MQMARELPTNQYHRVEKEVEWRDLLLRLIERRDGLAEAGHAEVGGV